jgi:hypothetical protein
MISSGSWHEPTCVRGTGVHKTGTSVIVGEIRSVCGDFVAKENHEGRHCELFVAYFAVLQSEGAAEKHSMSIWSPRMIRVVWVRLEGGCVA